MDFKQIFSLMEKFEVANIANLELECEEFSIKLNKQNVIEQVIQRPVQEINHTENSVDKLEVKESDDYITSPLVGIFYKSSSPKDMPFVKVGDKLKKGEIVCIVEAMKMFNEVVAPFDCEILECLVEDASGVAFSDNLFKVRKE